jgi:cell fate (sporulation/competence/biofilm development) regulator YlbF (YheA/YmcA/DUF963 family)
MQGGLKMYIYDKANELANLIQQSDEYKLYKELKDRLYADEKTKTLLTEYKKQQFAAQAAYLSGATPDAAAIEQLKKFGEVLQFNSGVTEFFTAEYRFNTMISDIYKIIGDACDIDLGLLRE